MPDYVYRNFHDVKHLILEADVLIFRGRNPFISPFVRIAGRSEHTHIALASWKYTNLDGVCKPDILECVEFKEFKGARTTALEQQVKKYSGRIDVFRPSRKIQLFDSEHLDGHWIKLDPVKVTNKLRNFGGLPYSWKTIFWLSLTHLPFSRLFFKPNFNDKQNEQYFVCSTAMSAAFRDGYTDPVRFLADSYTEPGHFVQSSIFNYLWTLVT